MITKLKENLVWLTIIGALAAILLFSGSSKNTHQIFVSGNETVIIKTGVDEGFIGPLVNRPKDALPVGHETIKKSDRILAVYYKVDVSIRGESALLDDPLEYVIDVPGAVITSNADRISEGTAAWIIGDDKNEKVTHATRSVRWWLLLILIFCAGYSAYSFLKRRA